MKTELLPSQKADIEIITNKTDLPDFSEPGTGKTLKIIGAIEKCGYSSGVIVCPTIAAPMWAETIEEELGAAVQLVKTSKMPMQPADFYVVTYGILIKRVPEFAALNYDALVCDESHYLRVRTSQRTQAVFGEEADGVGGLYEGSKQCWQLTGTPIERYADDLWSQLRAVQPEALFYHSALSYNDFCQQFCIMKETDYGYRSVANQNEILLNHLLYKHIGIPRRKLKDVDKELPPVTYREIAVNATINQELRDSLRKMKPEDIERLLMEESDFATRLRRYTGVAKYKECVDYIWSQASDHPVVVGYWHRDFRDLVVPPLRGKGCNVAVIDGSVDMDTRVKYQKAFNEGKVDVLFGQIRAMGVSLNLQKWGNHVIIAEDDWQASSIEQFVSRVHRIGQRRHVQVDFLRSEIPVDKALRKVREKKAVGNLKILDN